MEKTIKKPTLPTTDSIEALAAFWDANDLTNFEQDLEEAGQAVFVHAKGTTLRIDLQPPAAQHLKKIARSKGVKETTVVRRWILERLKDPSSGDV